MLRWPARTAADRQPLGAPRPTPFVVLCHARSGSNMISWCLADQEAALEFGEIFHETPSSGGARAPKGCDLYQPGADAAAYLENVIFRPETPPGIRAVGFKMFFEHNRSGPGPRSAWKYLIERTDIRVIHLVRRNLLDCKLSHEVALRSGHWYRETGSGGGPRALPPFTISPWTCQSYFTEIVAWRAWAEQAFREHPIMRVDYDDLSANFPREMGRIFDFLGLPAKTVEPRLTRQRDRAPSEQILNYEELRRWFRHTLFEDFFPPPPGAP
jgi:LPS sulfotransferase NodH